MSYLVYGALNIVDLGIHVKNRLHYHIVIFWTSVGLNIALNYVLIPSYGYVGSAIAMLASSILLVWTAYIVANQLFPVVLELRRLAHVTFTAIVAILLGIWLAEPGAFGVLIRVSVLSSLLATWYWLVLSQEEREWLRKQLIRLRHRARATLKKSALDN
jgi:O-antigen/teichoic acid export membrane protein